MTFEQAAECLSEARKAQLARLVYEGTALPQGLTPPEETFCFGLGVYCEYGQREELAAYFTNS